MQNTMINKETFKKAFLNGLKDTFNADLKDSTIYQRYTVLATLLDQNLIEDFEKTNAYAHQAITLASIQQNKFRLANGYQYLVTVNQNTGRLDSSEYYLKLLASLSKSGNEKLKISYE